MVRGQIVPLDVLGAETVGFSRAAPSVERGYWRHGPVAGTELSVVLPTAGDGGPPVIRFVRRGHHVTADAQRVAAYLPVLVERELGYGNPRYEASSNRSYLRCASRYASTRGIR